jgi:hypothetical protein
MAITRATILDTTVHGVPSGNYDGSSQDWTSDPVKAANYYRGQGSIQTVTFSVTNFTGTMHVEATLSADPAEAVWFDTFTYGGSSPFTDYHPEAIVGNFTWMRVRVEGFDSGIINSVTIAY